MDMNYDLTTKGVEMFKEMLAKNRLAEIVRLEQKALKKAGTGKFAYIKTVGESMTNELLERGWEIRSHNPSNYMHDFAHYVLVKTTAQLAIDLRATSV